jgi:hypothetical protein
MRCGVVVLSDTQAVACSSLVRGCDQHYYGVFTVVLGSFYLTEFASMRCDRCSTHGRLLCSSWMRGCDQHYYGVFTLVLASFYLTEFSSMRCDRFV